MYLQFEFRTHRITWKSESATPRFVGVPCLALIRLFIEGEESDVP
jgi:hypothetical protein